MSPRSKILLALGLILALHPETAVAEDDAATGRALFEQHKCNLCHGVAAAGIEAKTTSAKLKGPELGLELPPAVADLAPYLRKLAERNGITHKREFKGTDEELQTIVDWLSVLAQEAAEVPVEAEGGEGDRSAS